MQSLTQIFTHRRFRFWFMMTGVAVALLGFEEVVDDVFNDPLEGDLEAAALDRSVAQFIGRLRNPHLTQVMTDLTALGSISVVLTLFFILASILATYRDFKGLSYLTILLLGAGAWPFVLKPLFDRPRPPEMDRLISVSNLSFPSGHSFGASAVYIGLAYYAAQYTRSWAHELFFYCLGGALIFTVGVSRIYLGVHYPTDVFAGLCGGAAWGLLTACGYEYFSPTKRRVIRSIEE
jgi:undecaprenyl-diphosphatase